MFKTYFRLLKYSYPLGKFATPYIFTTIFAVFFGTLNFALIIPLLDSLFSAGKDDIISVGAKPEFQLSIDYLKNLFNYYFQLVAESEGKFGVLKYVCGVIVFSAMMSNLFKYLSQRIIENLRLQTIENIRISVFNRVMDLHLGFFNSQRKGDIIAKISGDVGVVQQTVTSTMIVLLREPLQLIAYFYVLFSISWQLTLFSMLVIPISGFSIAFIMKRLRAQANEVQQRFGNMVSFLDESLMGIKIVKAFNATPLIKQKYYTENRDLLAVSRKMVRRQQLASPLSEFLGITTVACIMLYGGHSILVSNSGLSAAEFITYVAIFSQVTRPAKAISDAFTAIHTGLAAGHRVLDLIDTPNLIEDKSNAYDLETFSGRIEFKNVGFAYQEKQILNNISFTIEKGQTIALVGPSGGGKSTICDLVPRFFDINEGEILMDEHNLKNLTQESIRKQVGIVPQESMLFNDTIFNNISFGKPDASMEEVIEAAKVANAHQFIVESTDGYNTKIGDRGTRLSGGQRQRICIARAVLKNPPIMLLDEATSALDTESEKLVQDALMHLMENRTSLVIAHRLSTIQSADKIIVIEKGEVVEQGSHQELLAKEGLYYKLINMQSFNDNQEA